MPGRSEGNAGRKPSELAGDSMKSILHKHSLSEILTSCGRGGDCHIWIFVGFNPPYPLVTITGPAHTSGNIIHFQAFVKENRI